MQNRLRDLVRHGQSPWQDNIHRGLLVSGELARSVRSGDVTGLTSNPTIFEQAINQQPHYDSALQKLVRANKAPAAIVDALMIEDIRAATRIFAPVYARTKALDGYCSIEVNPELAHDTQGTIREARRVWKAVGRPNLMVKIPATLAGLPAITACIADGINVNVTLIFSLERYDAVMDAYLDGLERRVRARKPVAKIASVASFFVSRVDSAIDKQVDQRLLPMPLCEERRALERLRGRAAIANARLAYARFTDKFGSARFAALAAAGAQVQRPLWASTSTKNPAYPDTYYVDALVGPRSVNTMPPATLAAFKDHGQPENRIETGVDEARRVIDKLGSLGIAMSEVTEQLEREGVASFQASYRQLIAGVAARAEAIRLLAQTVLRLPGPLERRFRETCASLDRAGVGARLLKKDPTLWKPEDPAAQREITVRLGWLDVVRAMQAEAGALAAFGAAARADGFTHAVLCGMGGSSLAPEVFRLSFGVARTGLDLAILDSTDPAAVLAAERRSDPARTLYLISSKSGGTAEVNAFLAFFWDRVLRERGPDAVGSHFVAITDPGTSLDRLATERRFRHVFRNPPDIGGRYSALSYFGLVPAALIGVDVTKLLARAERMLLACAPGVRAASNPGLQLGAVLGSMALAGRDKLTLVTSGRTASFGAWVEQLVAESTGKEGKGVVPVVDEPPGAPSAYGKDRLFVAVHSGPPPAALGRLARAGHPVVTTGVKDAYDLGAEMLRWEIATAVLGYLLDINPFDQPNVQEAKDNTIRLLDEYARTGRLPDVQGSLAATPPTLGERLGAHLRRGRGKQYLGINAYLAPTPRRTTLLNALRSMIRDRYGVATTLGYGPRFLHSTGQLHKGGPPSGVFLELTTTDPTDVTVPGERFTFGLLKQAQALGDLTALAAHQRPIVSIRLDGQDLDRSLATLRDGLSNTRPRRTTARRRTTRARR